MGQYLGELVSSDEIKKVFRARSGELIFSTVRGASKEALEKKIEAHKAEGWEVNKKNKHSVRLSKKKLAGDAFEDKVWSIVAQLGFGELNKSRDFSIKTKSGERQIDIYAKDDETVIIIECTQVEEPKKKSLNTLIEKICSIRADVAESIHKHYEGKKIKVKWIIATQNIEWGNVALERAEKEGIYVLKDKELSYYRKLQSLLGGGSKYQFLASILSNEKIPALKIEVPASKGRMGKHTYYSFFVTPKDLLKITYIGHKAAKDDTSLNLYQRLLNKSRLKNIGEYIDNDGLFPTNIVINFKNIKGLWFDKKQTYEPISTGILHLPPYYASAWIIDGQHRLYGYTQSKHFNSPNSKLAVLAFENIPASEEVKLFVDINSKQVKVSKNLLLNLADDLMWDSPDPDERLLALASRTVKFLATSSDSPLANRIILSESDKKDSKRCLTMPSLHEGILENHLLGEVRGANIKPRYLSHPDTTKPDLTLKKAVSVLAGLFSLMSSNAKEHWDKGDATGGYLCTNNGIRAFLRVFQEVAKFIEAKDGIMIDELSSEEIVEKIKEMFLPIAEFFGQANIAQINSYRTHLGTQGQKTASLMMMALIHEKNKDFLPHGLKTFLDSREEHGTVEAREIIFGRIQPALYEYVCNKLKNHFNAKVDQWWAEGVPSKIREGCVVKKERDPDRKEDPSNYLELIDYHGIAMQNWELMREELSLSTKDGGKEKQLKWLKELNTIRNVVAHPEKGLLNKEQVGFVKEVTEKLFAKLSSSASKEIK